MENTVITPPTPARLALKWGLICGMILVIYSLTFSISGLIYNTSLGWLSTVISIAALGYCMYAGMGEFKKGNEGYMRYGQGLTLGTLMSGVSGVISGFFSIIYNTFIDPGMMHKIMEIQKEKVFEQWEKQGISDSQAEKMWEQTQSMMGFMQNPGVFFLLSVLGTLFFGFIIALIVSAIQKKDKPAFPITNPGLEQPFKS